MLERPAILQPPFLQGFGEAELGVLLDKLLACLPEHVRNGYLAPSNNHPEDGLLGILRTNSIRVSFPGNDVVGYLTVGIDFSRCNHRCAPLSLNLSSVG